MSTNYVPTVPNPPQAPRANVQDMQNNAQAIYNIWTKDHYTFNSSFPGLHQQSTYIAASDPAAVAGAGIVYSKIVGTESELFFRKNDGTILQLTSTGSTAAVSNGVTLLPGGLAIKWGTLVTTASVATITFNATSPFSSVFSFVVSLQIGSIPAGDTPSAITTVLSTTGATVNLKGNSTQYLVNYMAIGSV